MSKKDIDEKKVIKSYIDPEKKAAIRRGDVDKLPSFDEFTDSYTRTMERRIRTLETKKQLIEVQRNKLEEDRDNLRLELQKLKQPPTFAGILLALLGNGKAIVKSSAGPTYAVVIDSSIPQDQLLPGSTVLLHQRNFAILDVIPENPSPHLRAFREQLIEAKETIEALLETE